MDELHLALEDLLIVKDLAPREPPVYTMLGRIYHRLSRPEDAIRWLQYAIDLDPKESGNLKIELDNIEQPSLDGILEAFL